MQDELTQAESALPATVARALSGVRNAFFNSVPFQRVANINAAMDKRARQVNMELAQMRADSLLAAARICETRSRTLKSKPASFEALNCGSAIMRNGKLELGRLREERREATPSPDAGVDHQQSVGETITEPI